MCFVVIVSTVHYLVFNKKLELFLLRVHTLMNSYIYMVERGVNQKLYRFIVHVAQ